MTKIDYSRWAERYERELDRAVGFVRLPHEFFTRAKAVELLRLARAHLGDPRGLDALDAGCGVGLTDRVLAGSFASLTGADLSPHALAAAQRLNPGIRYELADEESLPFADGSFDLSFAICVLHGIRPERRAAFVDEVMRVTRPAGLIAIFEHNPWNPLTRLVIRRTEIGAEVQMLGSRELRELLAARGLTIVDLGHILLFPSSWRPLNAVERLLRRLSFGAQHYAAARP